MTIEQKAREIAEAAYDRWGSDFQMRVDAAEAGIIEGVKMALKAAQGQVFPIYSAGFDENGEHIPGSPYDRGRYDAVAAIRALIEEQKV